MSRDLEICFQSELWRILHQACSRGPIGGFNLRRRLARADEAKRNAIKGSSEEMP